MLIAVPVPAEPTGRIIKAHLLAPSGYRIGTGDLLHIAVWKNEELSHDVTVRPDGMISLPLINDVLAAGRTPMQLREFLEQRLKKYMPDPEVAVLVREFNVPKVSVIGEVARPGRYELEGRLTVLELLALAGGLTEFASRSRITIVRNEPDGEIRLHFDYDKAVSNGKKQENYELRAGDILLVR
jgi:polysaccharide export outer membrane protein